MNYNLASPAQRFVAHLYDLTILFMPLILLAADIIILAVWGKIKISKAVFNSIHTLTLMAYTVLAFIYFVLSQVSEKQATFGQQITHIFVADHDMKKLAFGKATLRYAPLGILYFIKSVFLKSKDLPLLAAGSVVHIAALVCWGAILAGYLYCIIDSQKASFFDRILSVRVYCDEDVSDFTLPQVQTIAALAFINLSILQLFKNASLYIFLIKFIAIFSCVFIYGWSRTPTCTLGLYFRQVVTFPRALVMPLIPSLVLICLNWGLVLYMNS